MKLFSKLFSLLTVTGLLMIGAAQAAPPAWVLGCSQAARRVALSAFNDPSKSHSDPARGFFGLGTDLTSATSRGSLKEVLMRVLDAKQKGTQLCTACALVDPRGSDVREIRLDNLPTQIRRLADWEYRVHATMAGVALHSARYPDANPYDYFHDVQLTPYGSSVRAIVRLQSTGWYNRAFYEVEMDRDRDFPVRVVRVAGDNLVSWPSISDPDIRSAVSVASQNVAMASFSRQPIARNIFTNIYGLTGWSGTYSAEVDILDATANSSIPLGRAQIKVGQERDPQGRTGTFVQEVTFRPSKTNPPRQPYTEADFRNFAADAALGLYFARRPDSGNAIVGPIDFFSNWPVIARVEIQDGESGQSMFFDVDLASHQEFPIERVAFRR